MKCEICGQKININWGNSNVTLCQYHASDSEEQLNDINYKNNPQFTCEPPISKGLFISIFVIEILLIIPWLPFAGLSAMAYDSGRVWPAIIMVGPFQAYPLLILISAIISSILYKKNNYSLATIWAISPILISFGTLALFDIISGILNGF